MKFFHYATLRSDLDAVLLYLQGYAALHLDLTHTHTVNVKPNLEENGLRKKTEQFVYYTAL